MNGDSSTANFWMTQVGTGSSWNDLHAALLMRRCAAAESMGSNPAMLKAHGGPLKTGGAADAVADRTPASFSWKALENRSAVSSPEFGGFDLTFRRTPERCRHSFLGSPLLSGIFFSQNWFCLAANSCCFFLAANSHCFFLSWFQIQYYFAPIVNRWPFCYRPFHITLHYITLRHFKRQLHLQWPMVHRQNHSSSPNASLKKWVFKSFLKVSVFVSSWRLDGREFHAFGPENEKLRSPNFSFNRGSSYRKLLEDLSLSRPGRSATDDIMSDRYAGLRPTRTRCMSTQSL